jgi:hypothetical protein
MNNLPPRFAETIDSPAVFVKQVRITATRGAESATLEPESGTLTQDARRSMRWDGTVVVPVGSDLIPSRPGDLLTPFGTTVTAELGLELPDGSTAFADYGVYVVDGSVASLTPSSRLVTLTLVDLADRVARYRFETPFTVDAGVDLADAINDVIVDRTGASPGLSATGSLLGRQRVFGLDPESDPWRELVDMAADFSYRIYYNRQGLLVLDSPQPPDPNTAVPVNFYLDASLAFESRPPNLVVARGEPSDATPPVQSVALDDDPQSPTFAGTTPGSSPYGRITRFFASPLILDQASADATAESILNKSAGAGATWDMTRAYDPDTDPDDVLFIALTATESLPLVVDSVTVDIAGASTLACRAISQLS